MSADVTNYIDLITSEHADKPRFVATVMTTVQGPADSRAVLDGIAGLFDIDQAVGAQLDVVGQWVGRSRNLSVPLAGVYFAFDTAGVGFDQGAWLGPFDPTTGIVVLDDATYRILLYAVIAANHWDGTIPGAYQVWGQLFAALGGELVIFDGNEMTMVIGYYGPMPDAVVTALITGGYVGLKPATVRITGYVTPSLLDTPVFGFDAENSAISGFDVGAWAVPLGTPVLSPGGGELDFSNPDNSGLLGLL